MLAFLLRNNGRSHCKQIAEKVNAGYNKKAPEHIERHRLLCLGLRSTRMHYGKMASLQMQCADAQGDWEILRPGIHVDVTLTCSSNHSGTGQRVHGIDLACQTARSSVGRVG